MSTLAGLAGLAVVLGLGSWLTGTGPGEETGSTTIRNLGIGLVALVGLPLAVWRGKAADQQADAAGRQADTALLNEHYLRGVELLYAEGLPTRLAGIVALRLLAEDHPGEYNGEIMKLLCAYLRHRTPDPRVEDVQAAMEAIFTCHARQLRLEKQAKFRLDLRGTDLTRAILPDSNLSGAIFGNSHFDPREHGPSSILRCADLQGAILTNAHLYGADLTGADLQGTDLTGAKLMGANLSGTVFGSRVRIEGTRDPRAVGLTQRQLDWALCDPDNLPVLDGLFEPNTDPPVPLAPPQWDPNGDPHPGSEEERALWRELGR